MRYEKLKENADAFSKRGMLLYEVQSCVLRTSLVKFYYGEQVSSFILKCLLTNKRNLKISKWFSKIVFKLLV